jgi:hypothetical protein
MRHVIISVCFYSAEYIKGYQTYTATGVVAEEYWKAGLLTVVFLMNVDTGETTWSGIDVAANDLTGEDYRCHAHPP